MDRGYSAARQEVKGVDTISWLMMASFPGDASSKRQRQIKSDQFRKAVSGKRQEEVKPLCFGDDCLHCGAICKHRKE